MKNTPYSSVPDWNSELVSAWQAFADQPDSQKNLNRLGDAIDAMLRICRPAESFGLLHENAEDIRQNAHILLLHGNSLLSRKGRSASRGYLTDNEELRAATVRGDAQEIHRELLRSLLAVLNHCSLRMRREIAREKARLLRLEAVLEHKLGVCAHPADCKITELSLTDLRELVLTLLEEAENLGALSKPTLAAASKTLVNGLGQADAARELGISRQALNQRLKPVRSWLERRSRSTEVPLS